MTDPESTTQFRVCLALSPEDLTVYLNKPALQSLVDRLQSMLKSDPEQHYELHVSMALDPSSYIYPNVPPNSVWTLVDETLAPHIEKRRVERIDGEDALVPGFDLNFILLPESELNELEENKLLGLLPGRSPDK